MANHYLRNQLLAILSDPEAVHKWLCHPGQECKDGCDERAIPKRLSVYIAVERRNTQDE